MPKTGTTSIQRWIERNASPLRDRWSVEPFVIKLDASGPERPAVVPYRGGRVNSGLFVKAYRGAGTPASMVASVIDDLDVLARGDRRVLLTGEAFTHLLQEPDRALACGLDELAARHDVRLAYYVRPQHTAVEAAWKQFGFRARDLTPAQYVRSIASSYRYLRTLERCEEAMPRVSFEIRGFCRELLVGGDVVTDFASTFLDAHDVRSDDQDVFENVGLPLEVANLLHDAPETLLALDHGGLVQLRELKELLAGWDVPESEQIRRSRLILRNYCHEHYEADNQELIRRRGWGVSAFVPPVDRHELGADGGDLEELDALWRPSASAAERHLVHVLLAAAVGSTVPREAERAGRLRRAARRVRRVVG
jgi:hypothetical protein